MIERLQFHSDSCELATVRKRVREFLAAAEMDPMTAEMCVLALDEACTNIIRHAYQNLPGCPIRISMQRLKGRVRFILRDYGSSCDPTKIRSRPLQEIRPGGVGVHIIKQIFDEVTYTPMQRGTKLVLTKNLSAEPSQ